MSSPSSAESPKSPDSTRRAHRYTIGNFILLLFIVLIITPLVYLWSLIPTNDGEWSPLQARLPLVQQMQASDGLHYHISNLRDFRFAADGSVVAPNYLAQDYALADLQRVWFGISHFGGHGLAHTFLSFEFSGDRFLVASVEARLHSAQTYHPLSGILRQYNKLIVLGTEQDIVGLRSHIRHERVLLYPLDLQPPERRYVFATMMQDAQDIYDNPVFYNTLFDNCTTNLLKYAPGYRFYTSLLDYRLLLPGYSDEVAQEKNWITNSRSLTDLRALALVDAQKVTIDAPDFSRVIRQSWNH